MPVNPSANLIAAVDLGSNSFHMIVARVSNGQLHIIDRLRETVRLGSGLDKRHQLSVAAQNRALACLRRFGQRLRAMTPGNVRCVGTNALRQARNAEDFLARAQRALGQPIEVIAGREEARLIYLGVAHSGPETRGKRLVLDIGGGSTELIVGKGFESLHRESLYMGCVSMSGAHFANGVIKRATFAAAELAAHQELQPVQENLLNAGWKTAIGASGTLLAVRDVLRAQGWSAAGITLRGLKRLRKALLDAGHIDKLKLSGLSADRAPVFPGGVAILIAIFEAFGLKKVAVSEGALREGLLYDLLGRIRREDVRERTIQALCTRYQVDPTHAERVRKTALSALDAVLKAWGLKSDEQRNRLGWAARLHEIGLSLAHTRFHKTGAYLIANSDLPGFSLQEQKLLAMLVRGHRRKYPSAALQVLPRASQRAVKYLCVLLRLAVLLHRARAYQAPPRLKIVAGTNQLRLRFPVNWLERHPLTAADLVQEAAYLKAAKIKLKFA
jgi:exopolyphosphatase/guanosine-5'-triphosphate,3'-diphosphate pyrophosphatase